jgi:hypothetical protein
MTTRSTPSLRESSRSRIRFWRLPPESTTRRSPVAASARDDGRDRVDDRPVKTGRDEGRRRAIEHVEGRRAHRRPEIDLVVGAELLVERERSERRRQ